MSNSFFTAPYAIPDGLVVNEQDNPSQNVPQLKSADDCVFLDFNERLLREGNLYGKDLYSFARNRPGALGISHAQDLVRQFGGVLSASVSEVYMLVFVGTSMLSADRKRQFAVCLVRQKGWGWYLDPKSFDSLSGLNCLLAYHRTLYLSQERIF